MIKIHVLKCGNVIVDKTIPNRTLSKNPLAYTGLFRTKKDKITLPVFCYLIKMDNLKILIDSSWCKNVRTNPIKSLSYILYYTSNPVLPENEAIIEKLESLNIKPNNIDYLIFTHADIDHINGIKDVKFAKKILISNKESKIANSSDIRYNKNQWKGINIDTFEFNKTKIGPFNESLDLLGNGKITLINTKGHSAGSTSILIKEKEKYIIISGDNGYNKNSYEKLILPGPLWNKEFMLRSLRWVQKKSKDKNCIEILMAHDTEQKEHIITL